MVHFVYPYLFWVLIIPFFILAALVITNKSRLDRLFDDQVLNKLRANKDSLPQAARNILFFTALLMMIIAMARPIVDNGEKKISLKGSNIVLSIDISNPDKMADDNSLHHIKQTTKILLQNMSNDEVAITAFANNAFLVSPFTNDKFSLEEMIDGIGNRYEKNNFRNFRALGELIVFLTMDKPNKIAVIVGNEIKEDIPEDFISMLSQNDIILFMIRNNADMDIKELSDFLSSYNINDQDKFILYQDQKELFYYPLILSLLLLLAAWSSLPKRIKK